MIERSPLIMKSAADIGFRGKLICRAQTALNVTFVWTRNGKIIKSVENVEKTAGAIDSASDKQNIFSEMIEKKEKYRIESTEQLDLITYQSVLFIEDVQSSDYGLYQCSARNELGFDTIDIEFNSTSKPDPPMDLKDIDISSSSVKLRWTAGFDGGLDQTFRVRYRPTDSTDPSHTYSDVFPLNSSQTVISGLNEDTEYIFGVQAINGKGDSEYTSDIVKAQTFKGWFDFFE